MPLLINRLLLILGNFKDERSGLLKNYYGNVKGGRDKGGSSKFVLLGEGVISNPPTDHASSFGMVFMKRKIRKMNSTWS